MAKDIINTLGASNHSETERSYLDYYGTDPKTTEALLQKEDFYDDIWEPCAGHNLMVDKLREIGYNVKASDIFDYGYGHEIEDFLKTKAKNVDMDIVTNPPYNMAGEFVEKALKVVKKGRKVCMLLRLQFLEGSKRYQKIYKNNPPKTVYVFTNRQVCSKVDDFTEGSAVAYCWIVWKKGYKGAPRIKWLSTK